MKGTKRKRIMAGLCIVAGVVCILLANASSLTQTVRAIAGGLSQGADAYLPYVIIQSTKESPTRMPVCTPPLCGPGEGFYCPGECPGGCGTICVTVEPSPTMVPCTAVACPAGILVCPGKCPGGCGYICVTSETASPTVKPTLTPSATHCPKNIP